MAYPTILFNASTGSDTAASGAGPATAITGTAAAHTGGVSTTTITLTNTPNLTDVLTDGSHVLWLATPSGRQFSIITAKDDGADTVTVEDTFDIEEVDAVNYAIGGKRATFENSRRIFLDSKAEWIISTETDQTVTSMLSATIFNTWPIVVLGNGNSLIYNFNSHGWDCTGSTWTFRDFTFKNTNATKTASTAVTNGILQFVNCIIGDESDAFAYGVYTPTVVTFVNCEIKNIVLTGVVATSVYMYMYDSYIHDCGQQGFDQNSPNEFQCYNSIITDNTSHGMLFTFNPQNIVICNCTIDGNGGSGIYLNCTGQRRVTLKNNILSNNVSYGMRADTTFPLSSVVFNANNNYFSNDAGDRLVWPAGENDTALDPSFVGSGNYNIGSNLANIGYPAGVFGFSTTESFPDIGASQSLSSGTSSSPKTFYMSSGLDGCN